MEGEPWKVLNTEFERKETLYNCCPELYVDVSFKVTATRRGAAYHSLITVPLFGKQSTVGSSNQRLGPMDS